jgi:hypothetical protein
LYHVIDALTVPPTVVFAPDLMWYRFWIIAASLCGRGMVAEMVYGDLAVVNGRKAVDQGNVL